MQAEVVDSPASSPDEETYYEECVMSMEENEEGVVSHPGMKSASVFKSNNSSKVTKKSKIYRNIFSEVDNLVLWCINSFKNPPSFPPTPTTSTYVDRGKSRLMKGRKCSSPFILQW